MLRPEELQTVGNIIREKIREAQKSGIRIVNQTWGLSLMNGILIPSAFNICCPLGACILGMKADPKVTVMLTQQEPHEYLIPYLQAVLSPNLDSSEVAAFITGVDGVVDTITPYANYSKMPMYELGASIREEFNLEDRIGEGQEPC